MKLDLGLVSLSLPEDEEPMAPVMFIAMGEKDEAEKLNVGPTMAKTTAQQFRRTLTVNVTARPADEAVEAALERTSRDLMTRVRGKRVKAEPRKAGDADGVLVEFTHEGQRKTPLRSLCWVGSKDRWIFTLNLTGLDQKKNKKAMDGQMEKIITSISF